MTTLGPGDDGARGVGDDGARGVGDDGASESERDSRVGQYSAYVAAAEHTLEAIERALGSLDAGTYGTCQVCGALIDDDVLERDPVATRCVAHGAAG